MSERVLQFQWDGKGEELLVVANASGLEYLMGLCRELIGRRGFQDIHLMTPVFGGSELTESQAEEKYTPINHVKIFKLKE